MKTIIYMFSQKEEALEFAADLVVDIANARLKTSRPFTMSLCGGSSPVRLYQFLASSPRCEKIPWELCHLFQGDERYVNEGDFLSNQAMIRKHLISNIPLLDDNFHAVDTTLPTAEKSSEEYEKHICNFFSKFQPVTQNSPPSMDLHLLGMGSDGHTASLFAGNPELKEWQKAVACVNNPGIEPFVPRVTFTFAMINRAKEAIILAAGEKKAKIAEVILESEKKGTKTNYPSQQVRPSERLHWIIVK